MKKITAMTLVVLLIAGLTLPVLGQEITRQVVVEAKYEDVIPFSEGLAPVKNGGLWGYVDETGKEVIPLQYAAAYLFQERRAIVVKNVTNGAGQAAYEYGVIDARANYTKLTDSQMKPAPEDLIYLVHHGVVALPSVSGAAHLFTIQGKEIKPKNISYNEYYILGSMNEGLVPVKTVTDKGFRLFYMDKSGNIKLDITNYTNGTNGRFITNLFPYHDGLALAWQEIFKEGQSIGGALGFINTKGNFVIQPQYKSANIINYMTDFKVFNDGIAVVQDLKGFFGGIDKTGKTVIPFKYADMTAFQEGLAAAKEANKTNYNYIDTSGLTRIAEVGTTQQYTQYPNRFYLASVFYGGVASVYDYVTEKAFLIQQNPNADGTNRVVGSEKLSKRAYFPGEMAGVIYSPDDSVVIEENGRFGLEKYDVALNLPDASLVSPWAYNVVTGAIKAGLVPNGLQNQYKKNISRLDFANLLAQVIENITGQSLEDYVKEKTGRELALFQLDDPFIDTTEKNIIAANMLGIINGIGNSRFAPEADITRQDAATLLVRTYLVLTAKKGDKIPEVVTNADFSSYKKIAESYKDKNQMKDYAMGGIGYVTALGLMNGTGNNNFSPLSNYSREQAIVTLYRLKTFFIWDKEVSANGVKVTIAGQDYEMKTEENETVTALLKLLPLEMTMEELNGNEKYFNLEETLPTGAYRPGWIEKGDVMLYNNNCLVIFYQSFSTNFSYTKIGHIANLPDLGAGSVKVALQR